MASSSEWAAWGAGHGGSQELASQESSRSAKSGRTLQSLGLFCGMDGMDNRYYPLPGDPLLGATEAPPSIRVIWRFAPDGPLEAQLGERQQLTERRRAHRRAAVVHARGQAHFGNVVQVSWKHALIPVLEPDPVDVDMTKREWEVAVQLWINELKALVLLDDALCREAIMRLESSARSGWGPWRNRAVSVRY